MGSSPIKLHEKILLKESELGFRHMLGKQYVEDWNTHLLLMMEYKSLITYSFGMYYMIANLITET